MKTWDLSNKARERIHIMKKIFALLLAIFMIASLCACAGEKKAEEQAAAAPAPGTEVSTFYQAIMDAQPEGAEELIMFEESNPDLIASFYPGLDGVELNQQVFYMPPIATYPCEIVIVEVKNSDDVQKVVDIFQARIELGSDDTCYPENAAGWKIYAQVQQSGNFVCMVVLPGGNVIPENVFGA